MLNKRTKVPVIRVSDSKDLIANPEQLIEVITKHDMETNVRFQKFWDAYSCHSEIFDTIINKPKPQYKPDYRISVNLPHYIVDTYNGFARGVPIKVSSDETDVQDYIDDFWERNDMDEVNAETHKNKCIFGEAYNILFVDEQGEVGVVATDPLSSFPVYTNGIRPKLRYFIRTYYDEDNVRHGSISDETNVYYFDFTGDKGLTFTEIYPHGFPFVPAVVFKMNSALIGLVELVLPMTNALDRIYSDKMNDIEALANAYLKILGGEKLSAEQIGDLREMQILNFAGEQAKSMVAEFMAKPTGDAEQEHLLDRLLDMVFTVANVVNMNDKNFATYSGIGLKMRMQPMANLAAGDWRIDKAALKQIFRLVFGNPVVTISADAWSSLDFVNTLNYPDDQAYAAEVAAKLGGIVSKKTQISVLPASVVPDVDKELEQIDEEEKEAEEKAEELMVKQAEALGTNVQEEVVVEESGEQV